jgi:hypothetical protein
MMMEEFELISSLVGQLNDKKRPNLMALCIKTNGPQFTDLFIFDQGCWNR